MEMTRSPHQGRHITEALYQSQHMVGTTQMDQFDKKQFTQTRKWQSLTSHLITDEVEEEIRQASNPQSKM